MNAFVTVVRGLGWLWIGLAVLLNLIVHAMIFLNHGFWALQEALSPFNIRHYLTVGITFAPGVVLLALADAIQQRRRKGVLGAVVALPVALGLVALIGFGVMSYRETQRRSASDHRTTEYKATAVRVKDDSATMYEHRNYVVTQTSGAVGKQGIPSTVKIGDVITVKGRTIIVQHIFVTEIHADMKWAGKVLAKKGDVTCVIVESEDNLPYGDESRNRLWIHVERCEPVPS